MHGPFSTTPGANQIFPFLSDFSGVWIFLPHRSDQMRRYLIGLPALIEHILSQRQFLDEEKNWFIGHFSFTFCVLFFLIPMETLPLLPVDYFCGTSFAVSRKWTVTSSTTPLSPHRSLLLVFSRCLQPIFAPDRVQSSLGSPLRASSPFHRFFFVSKELGTRPAAILHDYYFSKKPQLRRPPPPFATTAYTFYSPHLIVFFFFPSGPFPGLFFTEASSPFVSSFLFHLLLVFPRLSSLSNPVLFLALPTSVPLLVSATLTHAFDHKAFLSRFFFYFPFNGASFF